MSLFFLLCSTFFMALLHVHIVIKSTGAARRSSNCSLHCSESNEEDAQYVRTASVFVPLLHLGPLWSLQLQPPSLHGSPLSIHLSIMSPFPSLHISPHFIPVSLSLSSSINSIFIFISSTSLLLKFLFTHILFSHNLALSPLSVWLFKQMII